MNREIVFIDSVFAQEVDGEMMILDMNSQNYFGLDSVGSVIWQIMQDEKSIDSILERLLERYDTSVDILKRDLFIFIDELVSNRLIEVK